MLKKRKRENIFLLHKRYFLRLKYSIQNIVYLITKINICYFIFPLSPFCFLAKKTYKQTKFDGFGFLITLPFPPHHQLELGNIPLSKVSVSLFKFYVENLVSLKSVQNICLTNITAKKVMLFIMVVKPIIILTLQIELSMLCTSTMTLPFNYTKRAWV